MKVSTRFFKLPEIISVQHHTEHSECFKMTEWKTATLNGAHLLSVGTCVISPLSLFLFF